jgi:membrane protease YdiL (CAAX protease family)
VSEATTGGEATPQEHAGGLRGFMDKGGWWRYVAFLVVYMAIYLGSSFAGNLFPEQAEADLLSSPGAVFAQMTLPLLVGAAVLFGVSYYLGWNRQLFGRQPVYKSWWMWFGPAVALVPVLLRVAGIDWGGPPFAVVVTVLLSGLLVGVVEELMFRGFAVKMIRSGGHGELAVAALSSAAFALSHSGNLIAGQAVSTVAFTVFYTFGFGVLMYLTLRVTGFLVWAMLVHGLTDPTTILATGGIDKVSSGAPTSDLLHAAGLITFPLVFVGIVLLFFVRGRAGDAEDGAGHDEPRAEGKHVPA